MYICVGLDLEARCVVNEILEYFFLKMYFNFIVLAVNVLGRTRASIEIGK